MLQFASVRGTVGLVTTLVVLSLWPGYPAQAQQGEWKKLAQETESLYREGRYPQATARAKQALRVAEDTFGQEHPHVATSL